MQASWVDDMDDQARSDQARSTEILAPSALHKIAREKEAAKATEARASRQQEAEKNRSRNAIHARHLAPQAMERLMGCGPARRRTRRQSPAGAAILLGVLHRFRPRHQQWPGGVAGDAAGLCGRGLCLLPRQAPATRLPAARRLTISRRDARRCRHLSRLAECHGRPAQGNDECHTRRSGAPACACARLHAPAAVAAPRRAATWKIPGGCASSRRRSP